MSYYTDDVAGGELRPQPRRGQDGRFAARSDVRVVTAGELVRALGAGQVRISGSERRSPERLRDRLTRERDDLELALSTVAGQLARRNDQLTHLDRYPVEDPFADGESLQFEKTFLGGDRTYSYVAHRANGRWFLTGARSPQGITWEELTDFMGLGVAEVYRIGSRGGKRKVIG